MSRSPVALERRIEPAIDSAVAYLASRQCRNGGFCFYRSTAVEEPNLRDTYYAAAAYTLLQSAIPHHDRVVGYLASMKPRGRQSSYLYYYAFTAYLLDEPVLNQGLTENLTSLPITSPQAGKASSLADWLADSLKVIRLQKTFAGYSAMSEIADFVYNLASAGGVGVKPNLIDTYRALSILNELNGLADLDSTKDFINRLQIASFGFRYTQDSLSAPTTDSLYAGVFSCALLGLKVQYPADIVSSILLSQRVDGGFARCPGGLGDLATHFKALRIIRQLKRQ